MPLTQDFAPLPSGLTMVRILVHDCPLPCVCRSSQGGDRPKVLTQESWLGPETMREADPEGGTLALLPGLLLLLECDHFQ